MSPLARRITSSKAFLRAISAAHIAVYTRSGGRLGARFRGMQFLLLHHTCARTGLARTTPLLCLPDAATGALAVVGSNGGRPEHPAWLHNLRRTPQAEVTLGRSRHAVTAREADAGGRERLWPLLDAAYPYGEYRARAGREIAIVLLYPSSSAASSSIFQ